MTVAGMLSCMVNRSVSSAMLSSFRMASRRWISTGIHLTKQKMKQHHHQRRHIMSNPYDIEEAKAAAKNKGMDIKGILITMGVIGTGAVGALYAMGRPHSDVELSYIAQNLREEGLPVILPNQYPDAGLAGFFYRARDTWKGTVAHFADPSSAKLLPDPLPDPYQQPYTLVLDLDETLVHSTWDPKYGWRTMKRPGVDQFLAYVSQFYEVVVYSSSQFFYGSPICDKLDKHGVISYRLFRDATKYVNGHHVKDLDCLNRSIEKLIIVDDEAASFQLHPHNGIAIKPWKGDLNDRTLIELIPMLEAIARTGVEDVRSVLAQYEGKDIVATFTENRKRQLEVQQKAASTPTPSPSGLARFFAPSQPVPLIPDEKPVNNTNTMATTESEKAADNDVPKRTFWQRIFGTPATESGVSKQ